MYFSKLIPATFALCVFNLPIAAAEATIDVEMRPSLPKNALNFNISGQKSPLTEANIRNILEEMAVAANTRDIDGLLSFYAPNYIGAITISTPTGAETIQVTREDSREQLELSYQKTQNYQFSYSAPEITISNDGKTAKAIGTSNEEFTLEGKNYRSTSAWVMNFELINGNIWIISDSSNLIDFQEF